MVNAVAYWNDFTGRSAPLRLTAAPTAAPKSILVLGWSTLNP